MVRNSIPAPNHNMNPTSNRRFASLLSKLGGGSGSSSYKSPSNLEDIKRGIAYVETRNAPNAYGIQGKPRPSDGKRALGKYQVFETNLPSWTKEALGRELTKQEFLASPEAQEKVADHFMSKSLQQYGNAEDVASIWFTGRPVAKANNAADYTGTDNSTYQALFKKGMGLPQQDSSSLAGTMTGGSRFSSLLSRLSTQPGLA